MSSFQATITKSTGSWYIARTDAGDLWQCRTRGKLRLQNLNTSNPVAVGDVITIEPDPNYENTASIVKIEPRKNWIIRKANKLSSQRQILASNLDAAIMVASLIAPRTSLGFIDRFLLCGQSFHIPTILFINKVDLLGSQKEDFLQEIQSIYAHAEVEIHTGSALDSSSLEKFKERINGKRVLLTGHSGVGKSTVLNALYPQFSARVGNISNAHSKGKHTTTFAEMFTTEDGTQIIDTPGIRDFGVVDLQENDIHLYFPEFRKYMKQCKFSNCTHTHEPGCGVLFALENELIPQARYYSYRSILADEDDDIFK